MEVFVGLAVLNLNHNLLSKIIKTERTQKDTFSEMFELLNYYLTKDNRTWNTGGNLV